MARPDHDVAIVGARCAGASLATFLAQDGASVVLLDKDPLPSDQVLSTHTIHPPGIEVLDELGVGARVREVAPPSRVIRLSKNDVMVDFSYSDGRAEYCPRRERLDGLLQRAAVEAGAELMDRTRVTSLIHRNGRVAGVRASRGGTEIELPARLVVGADGRRSTVASLVQAEEYLAYDAPRGMYWSYWEAPERWRTDPDYGFDLYFSNRRGRARAIFQTDCRHLLLASAPPVEECDRWRHDPLAALKADLAGDPFIGPLIEGRDPLEKVRGTTRERYFFRRATGPGWILIGDAGHHKDFLIGDGITEALLQARTAAAAVRSGSDAALETWWRSRDVEAMLLYFFAGDEGRAGGPPDLQCVVFEHLARNPGLKRRFALVLEHQVSPYEVVPVSAVARWALGAVIKGHPGVIRDFFRFGRRASQANRELTKRKELLADSLGAGTAGPG